MWSCLHERNRGNNITFQTVCRLQLYSVALPAAGAVLIMVGRRRVLARVQKDSYLAAERVRVFAPFGRVLWIVDPDRVQLSSSECQGEQQAELPSEQLRQRASRRCAHAGLDGLCT